MNGLDKRYLVTGGAGFIGSHIAERLIRDGCAVRVLDNFATGSRGTAELLQGMGPGRCEILEGDIRDRGAVEAAFRGVTHVAHLAALPSVQRSVEDPLSSHEVNITGTLHLLDQARKNGIRRFVLAGSSSVYGDQPELPKREMMPPNPRSPYALGKLAAETYCVLFRELYGVPTVVLRYFNVFGPRQNPDSQYAAVIPLFIRALLQNDAPHIYGDGGQTRDFTYIENVVEANLLAFEASEEKVAGSVFNVACGDRTSLLDLLAMLTAIIGWKGRPVFEAARAGDVRDSQAAVQEAARCLGFRPRVGLREGLENTVAWYRRSLNG